jgi:Zn-dependent M28 family amino/carboxypeptidase
VQYTPKSIEEALRKHVGVLATDIGPRSPFHGDGLQRAERYIRETLEDAGLDVTEQPYKYYGQRAANLVARPPGAARSSTYYVVGAHYDTVPSSPGADDNASAVAVMLELARRLSENGSSAPIRLVAFTLEEPPANMTGQQGSRVFVEECKRSGDRVAAAIVLEMVGYTSPHQDYPMVLRWAGYPRQGNFIGIVGNWGSRRIANAVLKGFRRNKDLPVESLLVPFNGHILPETRLSDHASFWDAGLPALMVTDTAFFRNPNYHLPSDTPDTLDFEFMAQLVLSLENAVEELARMPSGD